MCESNDDEADEGKRFKILRRGLGTVRPCLGWRLIEGIVISSSKVWKKLPDEAIVPSTLSALYQPSTPH